jgi:hypothetical protein
MLSPGRVALLIQVPRTLRRQIKVAAAASDLTLTEFVIRALECAIHVDGVVDP